MDSSDSAPSPPSLEELTTRSATTLLLPWILGMAAANDSSPREVAVFVHQPTRSITLVEGSLDIESLLREIPSKEGPLPATKASIESLPLVELSEPGLECAICLSEYTISGGESKVKEMPCRHKFHSDCIDKWLGIHGSCPICRFCMPVEEKESAEIGGWRIHVFFARGRTDSDSDADQDSEMNMDTGGDEEGQRSDHEDENDLDDVENDVESPAQNMDIEL